jgi:hypothetical protein
LNQLEGCAGGSFGVKYQFLSKIPGRSKHEMTNQQPKILGPDPYEK